MKSILLIALTMLSSLAWAQDDPDIVSIPVRGLPSGTTILSYALAKEEAQIRLVVEAVVHGTTAFYMFDYVGEALVARAIGPRSLTADLQNPPSSQPQTRTINGAVGQYWRVDQRDATNPNLQLVSAPSLPALTFADMHGAQWQLTPPAASGLSIRHMMIASDGTVLDECVIEPNIAAVVDRVTTGGAWWVVPFGEPHLLVQFVRTGESGDRRASLRLYNDSFEVVAITDASIELDANRTAGLLRMDLTGDGEEELVFLSNAPSPENAVSVFRFVRRDGARRAVSFNLCSVRMSGPDVSALQRALVARGYSVGRSGVDGWYGPDTRAAVIRMQRDAGLEVTGVVNHEVWRRLGLAGG